MEGILQSIVTAGYRHLEGKGLSLYRYDSSSESFPDVWSLQDGHIVRRYSSRASRGTITGKVLQSGRSLVVGDTHTADGMSPHLPSEVRSFIAVPVQVHGLPWGVLYVNSTRAHAFGADDLEFVQSLARHIGIYVQETGAASSGSVELSTVRVLAATVDAKDHYTRHHSTNVSFYAQMLARKMNLAPDEVRQIALAGLLHDIGKIAIPDQILQKPGRLTAEERLLIQTHAAIGGNILAQAPYLGHLIPLVRHHHEWYNGQGYPDGLREDAIPLGAAILSLADAFDTMTTKRVYREPVPLTEAMAELLRYSGTQFHPDVVQAMVELVKQAKAEGAAWLPRLGQSQEAPARSGDEMWQSGMEGGTQPEGRFQDPLDFLVAMQQLLRVDDREEMLRQAGEAALHFWAADAVQIYLVNSVHSVLELAWCGGSAAAQQLLALCLAEKPALLTRSLLGDLAISGRTMNLADVHRDPRWPYQDGIEGPVAVLAAPIMDDGRPVGVIQVVATGESRFSRADVKVMRLFTALLAQGIGRVRSHSLRRADDVVSD